MKSVLLLALSSFWCVQAPQLTMEDKLALPCFKLSTQELFDKAEKEVVQTVKVELNSHGPLYLQGSSRANYIETDGPKRRIAGVVLGGFAKNPETKAGVLLRLKIIYDDHSITKYYSPAVRLDAITNDQKKGLANYDSAFLSLTPEVTKGYNNIEVTALSMSEGKRTKYVGTI